MTDAELRELAQIERLLAAESPALRRIFGDAAAAERRRRRRMWGWAGALTALVSLLLLACGLGLGVTGLAVFALCPPLTYGVVLLGDVLAGAGVLRQGPGRRR